MDIIQKVCAMAKDFYSKSDKSIWQLFTESGYLKNPKIVTREALVGFLTANPDLIESWQIYSGDKRTEPSWYFLRSNAEWIVGYASVPSQEKRMVYQSKFEACAEFILHELEMFAEHATRP